MVKIISFDVDGTLVDQEYNDLVWLEEMPALYSRTHGVDMDKAYEYVKGEFDRVGKYDLRWYDLDYWLRYFSLPASSGDILGKYEDRIRVFPGVVEVLSSLESWDLVITTSMPRDFLRIKMKRLNGSFSRVFSTVSDFKSVKTSRLYSRICGELGAAEEEVLHVGDLWDVDYLAPRQAGLHALCIDREGSLEGEDVIRDLSEIRPRLDKINVHP